MALTLTRAQVRRIDEWAVTRYGMTGLQLMENAGRNAAEMIDARYAPCGSAFIACGGGNNGGDGFVIARHLHNHGWCVRCLLAAEETRLSPDCQANYGIVRKMGLEVRVNADPDRVADLLAKLIGDDVIVDALLGTGFTGEVRTPIAELIAGLNAAPRRAVVAIDVPSGLDCDTGAAAGATIRADLTIAFVAGKKGFESPGARLFTGEVVVADIGAPSVLLQQIAAR